MIEPNLQLPSRVCWVGKPSLLDGETRLTASGSQASDRTNKNEPGAKRLMSSGRSQGQLQPIVTYEVMRPGSQFCTPHRAESTRMVSHRWWVLYGPYPFTSEHVDPHREARHAQYSPSPNQRYSFAGDASPGNGLVAVRRGDGLSDITEGELRGGDATAECVEYVISPSQERHVV